MNIMLLCTILTLKLIKISTRFPDAHVQCVTIHEYTDHIHQLGMGNYHISGFFQGNLTMYHMVQLHADNFNFCK